MRRSICIAFVGFTLASSVAFGQVTTPVPTTLNILQSIQQLQLNEAQQTAILKSIQSSVTPPAGPTVLATPPLSGETTQFVACQIANVGPTPANISILVIGHLGEILDSREATLESFHSFGTGVEGNRSQTWCQFTADVPASQLRADIVVFTGTAMTTAVAAR